MLINYNHYWTKTKKKTKSSDEINATNRVKKSQQNGNRRRKQRETYPNPMKGDLRLEVYEINPILQDHVNLI